MIIPTLPNLAFVGISPAASSSRNKWSAAVLADEQGYPYRKDSGAIYTMTGLEAGRWYGAYLGQLRATNAAAWHTLQVQRQGRERTKKVGPWILAANMNDMNTAI